MFARRAIRNLGFSMLFQKALEGQAVMISTAKFLVLKLILPVSLPRLRDFSAVKAT